MSARSKARKRALDILFSADVRGDEVPQIIAAERIRQSQQPDRAASWAYASQIAQGVTEHHAAIDELIEQYARGWRLERMPAVDRAVLRIGAWEVLYNAEVPNAVAIAEAVELAREYSTDDSPAFVNGVLGALAAAESD